MNNEIDTAFELLRIALMDTDGCTSTQSLCHSATQSLSHSVTHSLSTHEWWRLFRLMQQNHVAAMTADTVAALDVPREVKIPWLAERDKAERWHRYQKEVQDEIVGTMQKHGIETLVLKGTHTAQYYPTPELREFGDLDLYFYDHHDEADHLIQRRFGVAITNDINHHTKYNLSGVTVESHYHLLNHYHPRSNRSYETLLQGLAPSPTFEILFLLRHMACHFAASRITLRDLIDWTLTCRAHEGEVDWATVEKAVCDYGMTEFVAALCKIGERRLDIHFILQLPTSGNVDRIERDIVYGNPQSVEREHEDLGRLVWKLRRHQANRWKQQLVFNDSPFSLWLSNLGAHTHNPRSILHKM